MEMQYIIYMQEACGPPHIDHYRSKLCSLYTSNDEIFLKLEWSTYWTRVTRPTPSMTGHLLIRIGVNYFTVKLL